MRDDSTWLRKHLELCGYEVIDLTYLRQEQIEDSLESLYLVKLRMLGEVLERIVCKHIFKMGQSLDMYSKNIQVLDMLGKDDEVIFPVSDGKRIELDDREPIMKGGGLSDNTVIFFKDYVSVREHIFDGDKLIQVVFWVRTDEQRWLNKDKFGFYRPTQMSKLEI